MEPQVIHVKRDNPEGCSCEVASNDLLGDQPIPEFLIFSISIAAIRF
jgi:hypothetical protein